MTQGVTSGDMFVNFGKCLQTFSNSGKIAEVESNKASKHKHLASLGGSKTGEVVTMKTFMTFLKNPILRMRS